MLCNLCPNNCNADRSVTAGKCGVTDKIKIAKYYLHKFEEPIISGENGSGTVFFCGCSLGCVFCQNYELSRNLRGKEITTNGLADIFKELEDMGATNVNLVTPTHYVPQIAKALDIYKPKIPVVYNTHSYENLSTIKFINDYVDIYLPDIKYFSPTLSNRYTCKSDYFEKASEVIDFMANSKKLEFFDNGTLKSGVIVRHLVLPQGVADSKKILDWFKEQIDDKAYINVMSQYTPFGDISKFPELNRKITRREYENVLDYAMSLNIKNVYYQEQKSASTDYIPKWDY